MGHFLSRTPTVNEADAWIRELPDKYKKTSQIKQKESLAKNEKKHSKYHYWIKTRQNQTNQKRVEMEQEKRKIEFLAGLDTLNAKIATYAPKKPFTKKVEVTVLLTYGGGDNPRPSTRGFAIYALAVDFSSLLVFEGYIKAEKQITKMTIEKRESSTPSISFSMQEVE